MQSDVEADFATVAQSLAAFGPLASGSVSGAAAAVAALKDGRRIALCGNGVSVTDAKHPGGDLRMVLAECGPPRGTASEKVENAG